MDVVLYDKISVESGRIIEAINGIPPTGERFAEYLGEITLTKIHDDAGKLKITAPNCENFLGGGVTYLNEIVLDIKENATVRFPSSSYKKITFKNPVRIITNTAFAYNQYLTTIDGIINLSTTSANATYNMFANCYFLEEVRFTKSSLGVQPSNMLANCRSLSDASIVSIANALNETVSGLTITFPAAAKERVPLIVGTVTDGVFEIDASGVTTLSDFITNTKGWTVG